MRLYHGTTSGKNFENFKGFPAFLTPSYQFASDYGYQKSFEQALDADVIVLEFELSERAKVFDPHNEEHKNRLSTFLPDKVQVFGSYYQSATLAKNDFLAALNGEAIQEPKFLSEDLLDVSIGSSLPDRIVYQHPHTYVFMKQDNDNVFYMHRYSMDDFSKVHPEMLDMYYKATVGQISNDLYQEESSKKLNEWLHNILDLSDSDYRAFYGLQKPKVFETTKHQTLLKDLDIWFYLESPGIFEAIKKAGFDAVKNMEKGAETYAVLSDKNLKRVYQKFSFSEILQKCTLAIQENEFKKNDRYAHRISLKLSGSEIAFVRYSEYDSFIKIDNIKVSDHARKQGLGSFMIRLMQGYAELNNKGITLDILYEPVRDFYTKNCFTIDGDMYSLGYEAENANDVIKNEIAPLLDACKPIYTKMRYLNDIGDFVLHQEKESGEDVVSLKCKL